MNNKKGATAIMTFYENLEKALKIRNIEEKTLKKDLKLKKSSTDNWKKRGNTPSGDEIYKIAQYLEMKMESFITGIFVDDVKTLSEKENTIIKKYRQATKSVQDGIDAILEINNAPSIADDMVKTVKQNSNVPTNTK